jgi:predicted phage-related endonuclease
MARAQLPGRQANDMRRIGGSDIAKLLGLSRYGGEREVYQRIVEGVDTEWNAVMARGTMMEPVLRAEGQRLLGLELETVESDYVESAEHEFAHAQIDDLARWQGQPVVVEYKSQSQFAPGWLHGTDGDEIPAGYAAQVAWQLMVTGRELALVVVGFGQDVKATGDFELSNVTSYEVQRDEQFEAYCLHVARTFWEQHVLRLVPPVSQPLKKKRKAS